MEKQKDCFDILPGTFHHALNKDDESYLIGAKCQSCGRTYFPKRSICPICKGIGTMKEVALSKKGKIDTFTVINVAPTGFKAPYIQAYIYLPEGPRVFSLITGIDPLTNDLKDGQEVELVIEKIREDENGNDLIGYKFKPIS